MSKDGDTITFYAQWKPNTYTVKYNANGGTGSMKDATATYNKSSTLQNNSFKREGYTFAGWKAKIKSTNKWVMNGSSVKIFKNKQSIKNLTAVNKDTVTFYAQWKPNTYTVKYNANGGTGSMKDANVTYNTSPALRNNTFTKKGYTFAGWTAYINSSKKWVMSGNSKRIFNDKEKIKNLTPVNKGTVTFYAQWKPNKYAIQFDPNGGTGSMSPLSMTYGTASTLPKNQFYRTGYQFTGWTVKIGSSDSWLCSKKDSSGKFIYAYYTDQKLSTGSNYGYSKHIYNNMASVSAVTSAADDTVTLYANWKPINYTVRFDPALGSGIMDEIICTYGQKTALPKCTFTRPGYEFIGWQVQQSDGKWKAYNEELGQWKSFATKKEAAENGYELKMYGNEVNILNTCWNSNDFVTFVAQWKKI